MTNDPFRAIGTMPWLVNDVSKQLNKSTDERYTNSASKAESDDSKRHLSSQRIEYLEMNEPDLENSVNNLNSRIILVYLKTVNDNKVNDLMMHKIVKILSKKNTF